MESPIPLIVPLLFIFFVLGCFPTTVRSQSSGSDVTTTRTATIIRLPSSSRSASSQPTDVCPALPKTTSPVHALSCPINCFRPNPVCGVDGVTYWCGCQEAQCAGVKVAKLGFCEVGNGGSDPLSAQALLLVHIVWLIVLGFSVLFGLF